ncbi:MAG: hypothetical protein WC107_07965 [Patescibacteria group bacterium]|jgi:hypothetical protein
MSNYTFKGQSLNLSAIRAALPESIEALRTFKPSKGRDGLQLDADLNLLDGSLDFSKRVIDEPCPALHLHAGKGSRGLVCNFSYQTLTKSKHGYTSSSFIIFGDYSDSLPAIQARNTEKNLLSAWQAGLDALPEQFEKVCAFYNIKDSSL